MWRDGCVEVLTPQPPKQRTANRKLLFEQQRFLRFTQCSCFLRKKLLKNASCHQIYQRESFTSRYIRPIYLSPHQITQCHITNHSAPLQLHLPPVPPRGATLSSAAGNRVANVGRGACGGGVNRQNWPSVPALGGPPADDDGGAGNRDESEPLIAAVVRSLVQCPGRD